MPGHCERHELTPEGATPSQGGAEVPGPSLYGTRDDVGVELRVRREDDLDESRLFVAPSHRREGLGGSLLTTAADAGLARGLWPILDVAAHFGDAIRLYEKAGWTRVGRVTVAFPDDEPLEELVYIGPAPDEAGR